MTENAWDKLAGKFDTHKQAKAIDPAAADNIMMAWPSLLDSICLKQPDPAGLKALDFGCGAGGFCARLQSIGYDTVGCDSAENMVAVARKNLGHIPFYVMGEHGLSSIQEKPFDLVTAVMVFQFIKGIEAAFRQISMIVKPGGILAFAVFNPAYIGSNNGADKPFQGFDAVTAIGEGYFYPNAETGIPLFIRSESDYDDLLSPFGWRRFALEKPPFTSEFLESYPSRNIDTTYAKYTVMAYQK